MNLPGAVRYPLKLLRWQMRRKMVAFRWGEEALAAAPIVLANAMPKSGSHLISQIVQGLTRVGPFVNPGFPPVNRDEMNEKLPEERILANLLRLRCGDVAYGYLPAREPYLSVVTQEGWATLFVFRDPRDMVISHVHYATEMNPLHGMHRYYTERMTTMKERLRAAIQGVDEEDVKLSSLKKRYEGYIGWLKQPQVHCVRFEDLIHSRRQALNSILDFLVRRGFRERLDREKAIAQLESAISPHRSGTFRKGQPGNWREYFDEEIKALFKEQTGDLLVRLGYEQDNEW